MTQETAAHELTFNSSIANKKEERFKRKEMHGLSTGILRDHQ
jgi:hypothetical protein